MVEYTSKPALTPISERVTDTHPRPGVCFVVDHYSTPHAGTEGQLKLLVEGLVERGWNVRLASFRDSDYLRAGNFPAPVDTLNISRIRNPMDWARLARYLNRMRRDGFSIAHAFFNDASLMVPLLARFQGMQAIISRRDMGFWYTPGLKRLLRLTGLFVNACVCNSDAVKALTIAEEGLSPQRVQVVYNGYRSVSTGQKVLLEKISPDSFVVGIVANLRRIKRLDTLLKALKRLRDEGYPVEGHFIGGDGDAAELPALAQSLGIADACRFWGRQPEAARFIAGFDVAVLCSESEGFSNAIIEYLQFGKPVVCTRTGGNPEIVQDGVNGYLVGVGDDRALAAKIASLLDDINERERMGTAGKSLVAERFSMETMVRQHETLYLGLG